MKSIIKGLFLLFTMCLSFTSCREDPGIADHGQVAHPELETQGVYKGVWTMTNTTTAVTTTGDGTITLTASSEAYITNMAFKCDAINLDVNQNTNITPGGTGYMFYNVLGVMLPGASDGAKYSGTISKGGEISTFFKVTVRQGRGTVSYEYSFTGQKQ